MDEVAPRTRQAATIRPNDRRNALLARYREVRRFTERLCETLQPEDCVVQSMPDVSPTKWHFAHTSWFFETFILKVWMPGYEPKFQNMPICLIPITTRRATCTGGIFAD